MQLQSVKSITMHSKWLHNATVPLKEVIKQEGQVAPKRSPEFWLKLKADYVPGTHLAWGHFWPQGHN